MSHTLSLEVKQIITNSVNSSIPASKMPDDFQLAGNVLDSMAVTSLIIALEDHFGFTLNDEELTAEDFETVSSLTKLIEQKLSS